MKEFFTNREITDIIIKELKSGYDKLYSHLVLEVFNDDFYITDKDTARQALENYGVFNAINEVNDWVRSHGGSAVRNQENHPVDLADNLWYIKVYNLLEESEFMASAFKYLDFLVESDGRIDEFLPYGVWESEATLDMNNVLVEWLETNRELYNC